MLAISNDRHLRFKLDKYDLLFVKNSSQGYMLPISSDGHLGDICYLSVMMSIWGIYASHQ